MRLRALAKINLGLDILGKREDGYHEVRMIMQTIQMYDVLEMKKKKEPGISLSVNYPFIPNDERNLVYKAAKLLMDEFQSSRVFRSGWINLSLWQREWRAEVRMQRLRWWE